MVPDYMLGLALPAVGAACLSPTKSTVSTSSPVVAPRQPSPPLDDDPLRRVFQLIDANGDGLVSTDELHQHLHKLDLLDGLHKEQLTCLVQSASENGGSQLQFEDFKFLYDTLCERPEAQNGASGDSHVLDKGSNDRDNDGLPDAFRVFDVDGDGFISVEELRLVLVGMGFAQCQDLAFCESIVRSVDSNSDGLIDFCEFRRMMMMDSDLVGASQISNVL